MSLLLFPLLIFHSYQSYTNRGVEHLITQDCNLIELARYHDDQFKEEVALLYSPLSHYYLVMPTKHFHKTERINGTLFITQMVNAYFIPTHEVERKLRERRNRE